MSEGRTSLLSVVVVAAALALAGASSCGTRQLPPTAQLLVDVDTDAPLARPPGEPARADVPAPLFDRLRVEVLASADGSPACDGCRRDFVVDAGELDREQTSFGVLAPTGRSDLVVRVRLFRSVEPSAEPASPGVLDRTFALPPVAADAVTEVTAFLPLDAVGAGSNADAPSPVTPGRVFRHALHDGVAPRGCSTAAPAGEACVPGGAYWMTSAEQVFTNDGAPVPERVVVLSPFFVDLHEITVAELRASGLATARDPGRGAGRPGDCTYTDAPGPNEALPVDCVSWELAEAFCASHGAALPTEAQLEYLQSALRAGPYAWGSDTPSCRDAVFARWVGSAANLDTSAITQCVALGAGPAAPGSGARDVVHLGGGDVVDASGNVSEWAHDQYQSFTEPCWGAGLKVDPSCEEPTRVGAPGHVFRGGSWRGTLIGLRAQIARSSSPTAVVSESEDVGFRCARADR